MEVINLLIQAHLELLILRQQKKGKIEALQLILIKLKYFLLSKFKVLFFIKR